MTSIFFAPHPSQEKRLIIKQQSILTDSNCSRASASADVCLEYRNTDRGERMFSIPSVKKSGLKPINDNIISWFGQRAEKPYCLAEIRMNVHPSCHV